MGCCGSSAEEEEDDDAERAQRKKLLDDLEEREGSQRRLSRGPLTPSHGERRRAQARREWDDTRASSLHMSTGSATSSQAGYVDAQRTFMHAEASLEFRAKDPALLIGKEIQVNGELGRVLAVVSKFGGSSKHKVDFGYGRVQDLQLAKHKGGSGVEFLIAVSAAEARQLAEERNGKVGALVAARLAESEKEEEQKRAAANLAAEREAAARQEQKAKTAARQARIAKLTAMRRSLDE